ncbi:MAG TPA: tetratricopeptide repeat protein [Chthoniobacteraceae bacterium]|jgi:tetratricopeptide (TPR) repeat protein|nr:tetratricopeptide repeat protein [Chthoniobacteraceae bacterium]
MKLPLFLLPLFAAASFAMAAEESPVAKMLGEFKAEVEQLDATLAKNPDSTRALSARGDAHLFLGQFPQAVADYEKMIAIDPSLDAPHWRLGIAYHFTRQWEKSSKQFAKYHAYDGHDRENGVWKFLADAHAHDLATARQEMLKYTEFDREPFPAIYDLLAGRMTGDQFQAHLDDKKVSDNRHALFYGQYYRGLFEELNGHRDKALASLRAAVALFPAGDAASGGPGYMWQCARLHLAQLEKK